MRFPRSGTGRSAATTVSMGDPLQLRRGIVVPVWLELSVRHTARRRCAGTLDGGVFGSRLEIVFYIAAPHCAARPMGQGVPSHDLAAAGGGDLPTCDPAAALLSETSATRFGRRREQSAPDGASFSCAAVCLAYAESRFHACLSSITAHRSAPPWFVTPPGAEGGPGGPLPS